MSRTQMYVSGSRQLRALAPNAERFACCIALILCGCGSDTPTAQLDVTPPSRVTDLVAAASTETNILLTWTAPDDDGRNGRPVLYDVRYAETPLTDANWNAAQRYPVSIRPQRPGLGEALVVTNLDPVAPYHFALKSADDAGNTSEISNVACGAMAGDPDIRWHAFGTETGLEDAVLALATFDGDLIAGGKFVQAGDVTASRVARWDGSSWSALGEGFDGTVSALATYQGQLVAGGSFWKSGNTVVNNIAVWDGTSWSALGEGTGGGVQSLAEYRGNLIVGGLFFAAGGKSVSRIAS